MSDCTAGLQPRQQGWRVVIPVKGGRHAKSRLRPPEGVDRADLARAIALDTVLAACAAVGPDHVVVVTSDVDVTDAVRPHGVQILRDPAAGLNAAVSAGLATVRAGRTGCPPVAALLGDLPALRPGELRAALSAAAAHRSAFVPDADGAGTVLLAVRGPHDVTPRFGQESAAAHARDGHVRLPLDLPGLRRDVDDGPSLQAALTLGVGPHTAGLLGHLVPRSRS